MRKWKTLWGEWLPVRGARRVLEGAVRLLEGLVRELEARVLAGLVEETEGDLVYREVSPHARELPLPAWLRGLLWLLEPLLSHSAFTTPREVARCLYKVAEVLDPGAKPPTSWRIVLERLGAAEEFLRASDWAAFNKAAAKLFGGIGRELAPSQRRTLGYLRALEEALPDLLGEEATVGDLRSRPKMVRLLCAAAELVEAGVEVALEERLHRVLGTTPFVLHAREALEALQGALEAERLTEGAVYALGAAAAVAHLDLGAGTATLAEAMAWGAARAPYWARKWREGNYGKWVPLADFLWANVAHEAQRDWARGEERKEEVEEVSLEDLIHRLADGEEEDSGVELDGELAWRLAVHKELEKLLSPDEVYVLLEGGLDTGQVLQLLEAPPSLREAVQRWLKGSLARLRESPGLRALWAEI